MYFDAEKFIGFAGSELSENPVSQNRILGIAHHADPASKTFKFSVTPDLKNFVTISADEVSRILLLGSFSQDQVNIFLVAVEFSHSITMISRYFGSELNRFTIPILLAGISPTTNDPFTGEFLPWQPPWRWSGCAKCQLGVNAFISGTVLVACAAAGAPPAALAVAKGLIAAEYGVAAWEAVKGIILSGAVTEISRRICKARGEC